MDVMHILCLYLLSKLLKIAAWVLSPDGLPSHIVHSYFIVVFINYLLNLLIAPW